MLGLCITLEHLRAQRSEASLSCIIFPIRSKVSPSIAVLKPMLVNHLEVTILFFFFYWDQRNELVSRKRGKPRSKEKCAFTHQVSLCPVSIARRTIYTDITQTVEGPPRVFVLLGTKEPLFYRIAKPYILVSFPPRCTPLTDIGNVAQYTVLTIIRELYSGASFSLY